MEIKGKTAIITGGGTGIGRAVALKLAQEGANVVINFSRSRKEAEHTLEEVRWLGGEGIVYQADVSDNAEVVKMCAHAKERFGSIDMLINNAGTTNFVPLDDLDGLLEEYWDRAFNINVKGMFFVSRACAEALTEAKGCIVNITSIAGMNGLGSSMAYSASKAAAITLTKSLARSLAPHVRVNSVAPGVVLTRWVEGQDRHIEQYESRTPLGRVANPEDVAEMTLGLIRGGDFVTGQTIVVDGGATL